MGAAVGDVREGGLGDAELQGGDGGDVEARRGGAGDGGGGPIAEGADIDGGTQGAKLLVKGIPAGIGGGIREEEEARASDIIDEDEVESLEEAGATEGDVGGALDFVADELDLIQDREIQRTRRRRRRRL